MAKKCLILAMKTSFRAPEALHDPFQLLFDPFMNANSSLLYVITLSSTAKLSSNTVQNPSNKALQRLIYLCRAC